MRIGLIDQDLLFNFDHLRLNLELMKLANYYTSQGHYVSLILNPNEIEEYDYIILFKNKEDNITLSKVIARKNVMTYGDSFYNGKYESIEDEVFLTPAKINIYDTALKIALKKQKITQYEFDKLYSQEYIRLSNKNGCYVNFKHTDSIVTIYDDILSDDIIYQECLKHIPLYNLIRIVNVQVIDSADKIGKLIDLLKVLKGINLAVNFVVNMDYTEFYHEALKYKKDFETYKSKYHLIINSCDSLIYKDNYQWLLSHLSDSIQLVRIAAACGMNVKIKHNFTIMHPFRALFNKLEMWAKEYKIAPINFMQFLIDKKFRHPERILDWSQDRLLYRQSIAEEVILKNDEAFFI